jgi:hypothetical protein
VNDSVRVAFWNEEKQSWVEDGITDFSYNEAARSFQFYITTVGVLALVKDRVVDMPYRKW